LTPLLGIGACVSIQFSGMEAAKRFFKGRKNGGELGLGELWMSGAFAGTVNTVVANPVEHIRISMSLPRTLVAGTD
jgi:solute carrier family 25 carnitine/acylcarnitine transporter 20/29